MVHQMNHQHLQRRDTQGCLQFNYRSSESGRNLAKSQASVGNDGSTSKLDCTVDDSRTNTGSISNTPRSDLETVNGAAPTALPTAPLPAAAPASEFQGSIMNASADGSLSLTDVSGAGGVRQGVLGDEGMEMVGVGAVGVVDGSGVGVGDEALHDGNTESPFFINDPMSTEMERAMVEFEKVSQDLLSSISMVTQDEEDPCGSADSAPRDYHAVGPGAPRGHTGVIGGNGNGLATSGADMKLSDKEMTLQENSDRGLSINHANLHTHSQGPGCQSSGVIPNIAIPGMTNLPPTPTYPHAPPPTPRGAVNHNGNAMMGGGSGGLMVNGQLEANVNVQQRMGGGGGSPPPCASPVSSPSPTSSGQFGGVVQPYGGYWSSGPNSGGNVHIPTQNERAGPATGGGQTVGREQAQAQAVMKVGEKGYVGQMMGDRQMGLGEGQVRVDGSLSYGQMGGGADESNKVMMMMVGNGNGVDKSKARALALVEEDKRLAAEEEGLRRRLEKVMQRRKAMRQERSRAAVSMDMQSSSSGGGMSCGSVSGSINMRIGDDGCGTRGAGAAAASGMKCRTGGRAGVTGILGGRFVGER